jgi:hypothetical protein
VGRRQVEVREVEVGRRQVEVGEDRIRAEGRVKRGMECRREGAEQGARKWCEGRVGSSVEGRWKGGCKGGCRAGRRGECTGDVARKTNQPCLGSSCSPVLAVTAVLAGGKV